MHDSRMQGAAPSELDAKLGAVRHQLVEWLVEDAYPRWADQGVDHGNGGFVEVLAQNGTALPLARRARVQARQLYSFAKAPQFGWRGDAVSIVSRGLDYFVTHYLRPDGLFRTLGGTQGETLDERAFLYDQAFALLGYASAAKLLNRIDVIEPRALALRHAIVQHMAAKSGGFRSLDSSEGPRESNPHMHLLEACMAWAELGVDPGWRQWSLDLVALARARFIRSDSGAIGEAFTAEWLPQNGAPGCVIEPGHQFEWAWLFMRSEALGEHGIRPTALRLIEIGETYGVRNGVAINALLDDFSVHDADARFWPQTERLKAGLLAAQLTGKDQYRSMALAAAASFLPYLDTPVRGLWLDIRKPGGEIMDAPSPASSFYHIVCAIGELQASLARSD